eukprot:CAMPEP_0197538900 /NCGR_PEP_ID=MMETSP1318-20131121/60950_1 /TAXON_ID=552666 /ORGANISM="Partenskyella glossopodia, Strain RCC365" /LENGTH=474 /DNA_ID=CAMNT_0043097445 /DNA_START=8 /DNA_END=1432 /DNA_ORIENTATION=+
MITYNQKGYPLPISAEAYRKKTELIGDGRRPIDVRQHTTPEGVKLEYQPEVDYNYTWKMPDDPEERKYIEELRAMRRKNFPGVQAPENGTTLEERKAKAERRRSLIRKFQIGLQRGYLSPQNQDFLTTLIEEEKNDNEFGGHDMSDMNVKDVDVLKYYRDRSVMGPVKPKFAMEERRVEVPGAETKLYVANLGDIGSTKTALQQYFSQWGEVKDCYVVRHHDSGKCRGYGFVYYYDAEAALRCLNCPEHWFEGRNIDVRRTGTGIRLKNESALCSVHGRIRSMKDVEWLPSDSPFLKYNQTDRRMFYRCKHAVECPRLPDPRAPEMRQRRETMRAKRMRFGYNSNATKDVKEIDHPEMLRDYVDLGKVETEAEKQFRRKREYLAGLGKAPPLRSLVRPPSIMELCCSDDIQKERQMILKCLRFFVRNDFFDHVGNKTIDWDTRDPRGYLATDSKAEKSAPGDGCERNQMMNAAK